VDSIRVLYVEDDETDRELTRQHLERHAPHCKLATAGTVAEAVDRLALGDVDLVLSDYRLPDGTGLDLLEIVRARDFRVPVVLVTGWGDAEEAVRLLKAGAADYVMKRGSYLATLPQVIEGAFEWFKAETERRRAGLRVLYAEHDPGDVELTRAAFRQHGPHLHLHVVTHGKEVLARLWASPYDILLLDYRLPDLTGIEVLKALREERIKVPIVMVTGQGDEETAVQAFKLGVSDYIVKHQGYLSKLPSTLENVLAQRQLGDERAALLVLNELARSIATAQGLETLVRRAASAAADLLRVDSSMLWLAEPTALRPAAWVGIAESLAERLRLPLDESLRLTAIADRRLPVWSLGGPTGLGRPATPLFDPSSSLAISLVADGHLVGLLAVASLTPRLFTAAEERLLIILSDHTAIALENIRLYQELMNRLEELNRAQAQLLQTEKIAAMGQLLAGVAHELNSPLSVVMGRASLLQEQLTGGPLVEQAASIVDAAERCARIVSNFLALARRHAPAREPVALDQVVTDALELLTYQLRVDAVEVSLDLADDLPALWADSHQLHQVLVNLVNNAHHAMRETGPPRRLTIRTGHDPGRLQVYLEVADTGPGIPPEIQSRIFEPFFTTKPADEGTGLGLPLCQTIVDGHGGSIEVRSELGRGTTFRIELPARTPPAPPADTEALPSLSPLTGKTVLVVDDEPMIASLLAEMLSMDGHHVDVVHDGRSALARIEERPYDLIISDVRMPELDGPGLWEALEQRQPQLLRRFVFLTGDVLRRQTAEFLERIGATTLAKPATLEDVHRVSQQVLRDAEGGRS
jgi:signal transduction histidine kinase/FixJ family two-component response regulator